MTVYKEFLLFPVPSDFSQGLPQGVGGSGIPQINCLRCGDLGTLSPGPADAPGASYWWMSLSFERILVHGFKGVLCPQLFGELLSTHAFHCASALSTLVGKIATLAIGWDRDISFSSIPVTVSQATNPYWDHNADKWGRECRKQPPHCLSAQTASPWTLWD